MALHWSLDDCAVINGVMNRDVGGVARTREVDKEADRGVDEGVVNWVVDWEVDGGVVNTVVD